MLGKLIGYFVIGIILSYVLLLFIFLHFNKKRITLLISTDDFATSQFVEDELYKALRISKFLGTRSYSDYINMILVFIYLSRLNINKAYNICFNSFYTKRTRIYSIIVLRAVSQVINKEDDERRINELYNTYINDISNFWGDYFKAYNILLEVLSGDFNDLDCNTSSAFQSLVMLEKRVLNFPLNYLISYSKGILIKCDSSLNEEIIEHDKRNVKYDTPLRVLLEGNRIDTI